MRLPILVFHICADSIGERGHGTEPSMTLKYCPNGECVNFQVEVETTVTPMWAWDLTAVKQKCEVEPPTENSQAGLTPVSRSFSTF